MTCKENSKMDNVTEVQCYIHCQRNVLHQFNKKGMPKEMKCHYINQIFGKDGEIFQTDINKHIEKMDSILLNLENGNQEAAQYLLQYKLEELRSRVGAHIMVKFGLGDKPLTTNVPRVSMHSLLVGLILKCLLLTRQHESCTVFVKT